jgi:hypothetical protein
MHLVHLSFKVFIIRISPETIENLTKTTCSSFYLQIYSNIFLIISTFFFSTIQKLYLMNVRKALKVRSANEKKLKKSATNLSHIYYDSPRRPILKLL